MKKGVRILLIVIAVILVVAAIFAYGVYWAFFDIQRINGQEVLEEVTSPDGKYTCTVYLNNGGATVDYAVLCSVTNNRTGRERNIYWQYRSSGAVVYWIDETHVSIDGIALDVRTDSYDYRRQK